MIGYLKWTDSGRFRVSGEEQRIFDIPYYQVSLSEKGRLLPLRLKRANSLCFEENIRTIISPTDFPHWHFLPHLRPLNPLPTLQSLGGDFLLEALSKAHLSPHDATVVLQGSSVTPSLEQVALELAPVVKELVISVSEGGQTLQTKLYHTFGMAPCGFRNHSTARLQFQPVEDCATSPIKPLGVSKIILPLHEVHSPLFQGIRLKNKQIPSDIPFLPLLSFLLQKGGITKKDLQFF